MNSKTAADADGFTLDDHQYMRRALALARRGRGATSPNPMVGAIVVRDGVIVGEGYHPRAGAPHAEVFALRRAGTVARGATLYVTLEPCAHYGKTPPCADAVVTAGIARVIVASLDPHPLVDGRGLAHLRRAGIEVRYGLLAEYEQRLNEAWRHWVVTGLPFTTIKLAASLDGKIATRTGASRWITGEAARRDVHRARSRHDAILTTAATVLADDPALTARVPGGHDPRRIVVDARARTSPEARVYAPADRAPILITARSDDATLAPYRARGVEVISLPATPEGVDLPAMLRLLAQRDIVSLLVEAGGRFAAALITARLAQRLRLYLAPMLIGGVEAPGVFAGQGIAALAEAPRLYGITTHHLGDDLCIDGYLGTQVAATPLTPR